MKLNKKFVLLPALLLSLVACSKSQNKALEQSKPLSDSLQTVEEVEAYKVVLPNEFGVQFSVNNETPKAFEEVRLYVRITTPLLKRVDRITMNGQVLNGYYVEEDNVTIYNFRMPLKENAVIEADIAEVYEIKVAEEVKDYLTLDYSVTPRVAAEGETVQFKVATFPGYWYKYVTAVEDDVVLQEQGGIYSFEMPAHAVTISATTGENEFTVYLKTADEEAEDKNNYSFVGIQDGQTFAVGEDVNFTISVVGYNTMISKVILDGKAELELDETSSQYSFKMPAYDVELSALYDTLYRHVQGVDSEHFTVALKTPDRDSKEEVPPLIPVDHNLLANDEVYIEVTEKESDVPHNFVANGFKFKAGPDAENLVDIDPLYVREMNSGYRYGECRYFNLPNSTTNIYYEVTVEEVEAPFKNNPIIGEYDGGFSPSSYNYGAPSNESTKIDAFGKIGKYASSSYQLTQVDENGKHYSSPNGYNKDSQYFVNESNDAILYLVGASSYVSYKYNSNITSYTSKYIVLYSKGRGQLYTSSSTETYAIYTGSADSVKTIFIQAQFKKSVDSEDVYSTVSVYFDLTTDEIVWDAKAEILSGDRQKANSVVSIQQSEGTEIVKLKLTSTPSKYLSSSAEIAVASSEAGTYTKEGADDLVLDGFGNGTLGEEAITYTVKKENVVVVTKGEEEFTYVLNPDEGTYDEYTAPAFSYVGKTYSGTFYDVDVDEKMSITFNGEPSDENNVDVILGSYGDKTMKYTIGDDDKITLSHNEGKIVLVNQNGALKIESATGNLWGTSYYLTDVILSCPELFLNQYYVSSETGFTIEFIKPADANAGTLAANGNVIVTILSNQRYGAWSMTSEGKIHIKLGDGSFDLISNEDGTVLTVDSSSVSGNLYGCSSDLRYDSYTIEYR